MNNIGPLMKRVCAYTIDMVVVLIIASLVSSIPMLNKGMDDYQETYDKYEVEYTEYNEYLKLLKTSYEDELINEEEYTKLIEVDTYKEIIEDEYEDKKISKGEYNDIVEEINEEFNEVVGYYKYILSKKGISNSIITLVCTLLYFGVIQYFLKGQTIGKKILKLKVVSASDKKINILNYILRSLIVNDVLLNVVGILFLVFTTKKIYMQADTIIGTLVSVVEAIIIFLVLTREDQRGLHDLLFNTKVISTDKSKIEIPKETEIKTKSKDNKKTKSKDNKKTKSKAKVKVIEAEYKEVSE